MHIEIKSTNRASARRRTPGERLLEALQALANGYAQLVHHAERSWASITFAGTRHKVEFAFEGEEAIDAGECFIAFLPEHEFTIPGQLVADAAIVAVEHQAAPPRMIVTCKLLMLEEGYPPHNGRGSLGEVSPGKPDCRDHEPLSSVRR